jgi:hypothetical protein
MCVKQAENGYFVVLRACEALLLREPAVDVCGTVRWARWGWGRA